MDNKYEVPQNRPLGLDTTSPQPKMSNVMWQAIKNLFDAGMLPAGENTERIGLKAEEISAYICPKPESVLVFSQV